MTTYFEDLSKGDTFELGPLSMTKEEIVTFPEQFNSQPFHLDKEAAAESLFGRLVASGLHTLCQAVRLFVTEFVNPDDGLANMGGLGLDDVRWHEAVRPEDELSPIVEMVEMEPSGSRSNSGHVTFERRMVNQNAVDVLSFRSINIVRQRGGTASSE